MRRLGRRLLLASCLGLSAAAPDTGGIGFTQRLGDRLPLDLPLVASDGSAATLGRVLDHTPTVLILGYFACPMLCGVVRDDALRALWRAACRCRATMACCSSASIPPCGRRTRREREGKRRVAHAGVAEGWPAEEGAEERGPDFKLQRRKTGAKGP